MKTFNRTIVAFLFAGALWVFLTPACLAGRDGGPMSTVVNVPAAQSVFVDVFFDAGPAAVSITGGDQTLMQIYLYDTDGHVANGVGGTSRKTATMNVYRPGMFRVEIQNFSIYNHAVTFSTN